MVEEEYVEVTKHANGSKTRKKKYRQHFGRHDFFKEEVGAFAFWFLQSV